MPSFVSSFLQNLKTSNVSKSLIISNAPTPAKNFVSETFKILDGAQPHVIASMFTFGREEVIPEMFKNIIGTDDTTGTAKDRKLVFFKQFYDYDNIERYQALDNATVNHDYKTIREANNNMALFPTGQIFYATTENKFGVFLHQFTLVSVFFSI